MASPTYDDAFVDELLNDVDAYLRRLTVLTDLPRVKSRSGFASHDSSIDWRRIAITSRARSASSNGSLARSTLAFRQLIDPSR